jgi:hypothetical protein
MNSTNTPSCLYWHTRRFWVQDLNWICLCYLHFPPTASATAWFISLIYNFHELSVSSSLGHRVPATENLSLRHSISIFLTRTKLYGYNIMTQCTLKLKFWISLYQSATMNFVSHKTGHQPTQKSHKWGNGLVFVKRSCSYDENFCI